MPNFVQPEVEDKARQRIVRDIALIDSEWPAHTLATSLTVNPSGFTTPNSGTASLLLSVPSSTWFKPRTWWFDNENTVAQHLMVYTGGPAASCYATLCGFRVNPLETALFAMDCITVGNDLWIDCTAASCHVRVGGILIMSASEN
jgi:hypothetical protein